MKIKEIIDKWLDSHNKNYHEYYFNQKEPRWHLKQFFLQSYHLFKQLNKNDSWKYYIEDYCKIFLRDPSNDWYGKRSPLDSEKSWENSIEWTNIFYVIHDIGKPYNKSAMEKIQKYLPGYMNEALFSPFDDCHDFMICSASILFPNKFKEYKDKFVGLLKSNIDCREFTPHQLIIYIKLLENDKDNGELLNKIQELLIQWIEKPRGNENKRVLVWARLLTQMNSWKLFEKYEDKIIKNLNSNFDMIKTISWNNIPIILEALYISSSEDIKEMIEKKIEENIIPSKFYRFREIFPFLNQNIDTSDIQDKIEKIGEKCKPHPSLDLCKQCMDNAQGLCWIRILSKITKRTPWTHGPFEVADVVVFTFDKGIYFVIKSEEISKQRGEGDVLYRQCTQLFKNDHALVIYWNPCDTHPSVIEKIRNIATPMETNPRFEVIDKDYIRQVYQYYLKNEGKKREKMRHMLMKIFNKDD